MSLRDELKEPFKLNVVKWVNKGKGGAMAHLTSRDVMKRLDDVVGVDGWKDSISFGEHTAVCHLSIRIDGEWITKSDASGESNFEAEKGAAATAFKRAAVKFGVGRYLYYLPEGTTKLNMPQWALPTHPLQVTANAMIEHFSNDNLSAAREAWDEMTKENQDILWTAKSKGGFFTTQEKAIIQSTEFRTINQIDKQEQSA